METVTKFMKTQKSRVRVSLTRQDWRPSLSPAFCCRNLPAVRDSPGSPLAPRCCPPKASPTISRNTDLDSAHNITVKSRYLEAHRQYCRSGSGSASFWEAGPHPDPHAHQIKIRISASRCSPLISAYIFHGIQTPLQHMKRTVKKSSGSVPYPGC
jgi:hypothetical protein